MTDSGNDDKDTPAAGLEYPDEAGYPDGTGTLDEGTRADSAARDGEADESTEHADEEVDEEADEEDDEEADAIDDFAETDTEDE